MGSHEKDKCIICGGQKRVTLVTWFVYKGSKGHYLCRKHEREEVKKYKKGDINE